jgi:hypothetical protein
MIKDEFKEKKLNKEGQQIERAHEIQQLFRYHYKNDWVSQAFINQHDRLWIQTFNNLVKSGFVERKKSAEGYVYRWAAAFPEI